MRYRIKKVVYADGREVYLSQFRNRSFNKDDRQLLLSCLFILPAFLIIPFFIIQFFEWETICQSGTESEAQYHISAHKEEIATEKLAQHKNELSNKKVLSVIIPLKRCDHEDRG